VNRRDCILGCLSALTSFAAGLSPAQAAPPTLLVLGDSLSAEYGLAKGSGWVALLEQRLAQEKRALKVVNASISGDTTSGGLVRLPSLLKQHAPAIVVIELGANDALRGLPLDMTGENLRAMVRLAQAAKAQVLLLGMQVPPNYGPDYAQQFAASFATVAKEQKVALVPFFLKDVADVPNAADLFQSDRIHPAAVAHPILLNNVWAGLKRLLP